MNTMNNLIKWAHDRSIDFPYWINGKVRLLAPRKLHVTKSIVNHEYPVKYHKMEVKEEAGNSWFG